MLQKADDPRVLHPKLGGVSGQCKVRQPTGSARHLGDGGQLALVELKQGKTTGDGEVEQSKGAHLHDVDDGGDGEEEVDEGENEQRVEAVGGVVDGEDEEGDGN